MVERVNKQADSPAEPVRGYWVAYMHLQMAIPKGEQPDLPRQLRTLN